MTATGREAGRALFGDRVVQAWLPYDIPFAVRALPRAFPSARRPARRNRAVAEPRCGGARDGDAAAAHQRAAVGALGARLRADRAARAAARCARSPASPRRRDDDAARLRALGARDVVVTGNLKFDVAIAAAHARARARRCATRFGVDRPVVLLASTRDGEEALLLDALARVAAAARSALVVDRAAASAALRRRRRDCSTRAALRVRAAQRRRAPCPPTCASCSAIRWARCSRTTRRPTSRSSAAACLPLGGQNLIEPIAAGVPTLIGPHTFNFAQASDAADRGRRGAAASAMPTTCSRGRARLLDDAGGARAHARERRRRSSRRIAAPIDRLWAWLAPRIRGS